MTSFVVIATKEPITETVISAVIVNRDEALHKLNLSLGARRMDISHSFRDESSAFEWLKQEYPEYIDGLKRPPATYIGEEQPE